MAMTAEEQSVYNIILAGLGSLFTGPGDATVIQQLASFIQGQILDDIPSEEIAINLRTQDFYKQRFAGNEALKAAGYNSLSEAEYLAQENQYLDILRSNGLNNLATRENFASLIGGSVSPAELNDRVINVYDRIRNADEALSNELNALRQSMNINETDLASALLMGKDGTQMLKRKIAEAEISAEATVRGLTSAMGAGELAKLGVNRAQAAQGFENVKQMQSGLEKLGGIYNTDTTGLQSQLEKEQFGGMLSQKRKQLVNKELSTFSGKSGALTGQGMKSTSGQF